MTDESQETALQEARKALQEAIESLGSQTALANAIKTTQQNISYWLSTGVINADFVITIEAVSAVSRHRLRPDIYPLDGKYINEIAEIDDLSLVKVLR